MSDRADVLLRDAIRAFTDPIEVAPDAWEQIEARLQTDARWPRRFLRPAIAAMVAVSLVAGAFLIAAVRNGSSGPASSLGGGRPAEFVTVANGTAELMVLDSRDGHLLRTIADRVIPGPVSVHGQHVYFGRNRDGDPECGASQFSVARVNIAGGPIRTIAAGWQPLVSPDGRQLAYVALRGFGPDAPDPRSSRCPTRPALAIRDLHTGLEKTFSVSEGNPVLLAWSPDSSSVLYRLSAKRGSSPITWRLDVGADGKKLGLSTSTRVTLPRGVGNVFATAPDGDLLLTRSTKRGRELVLADPATGEVQRTIVNVGDRRVGIAALDASGRNVVYQTHSGDPTDTSPISFERVSVNGRRPVVLENRGLAVAWATDEKTPLPSRIVSVIEGNLVVLDSKSGEIVRTLTGAGHPGTPTVSSDGSVYYSRRECEIARVPFRGGRPEAVSSGIGAEASPDGHWLAIVQGASGPCDGRVQKLVIFNIREGYDERVVQVATGEESYVFDGWSPDSRRLLIRTIPPPNDAEAPSTTFELDLSGERVRSLVTPGPGVPLAYLGDTGLLATESVDRDLDGFRIVAIDPSTGTDRRVLARGRLYAQPFAADASGRHLLYWVTGPSRALELWRRSAGDQPVLLRSERARGSGGLPAVWVP
jgi:Tol biopolymer transport system component